MRRTVGSPSQFAHPRACEARITAESGPAAYLAVKTSWAGLPVLPIAPWSWPSTLTSSEPSVVWIRTGGETWKVLDWPNASEPVKTTLPVPSRTTTCAPPPAAVISTGIGAACWPPLVSPADPSARLGRGRVDRGRAVHHQPGDRPGQHHGHHGGHDDRPVGATLDAADRPVPAAGELGLEDPARVDGRVGVGVVVRRQQGRDVDAEHPGQGAQVPAGVEVAAARREVVDLDGLDDVRTDPGALGELVDREPQPLAGRGQLGPDHRIDDLQRGEVVDHEVEVALGM